MDVWRKLTYMGCCSIQSGISRSVMYVLEPKASKTFHTENLLKGCPEPTMYSRIWEPFEGMTCERLQYFLRSIMVTLRYVSVKLTNQRSEAWTLLHNHLSWFDCSSFIIIKSVCSEKAEEYSNMQEELERIGIVYTNSPLYSAESSGLAGRMSLAFKNKARFMRRETKRLR